MRKRLMQLSGLFLFGVLACQRAFAADEYLFDALKKPAYRKAWNAMLAGDKHIPSWLTTFSKTYNGVTAPMETITAGGTSYLFGYVCQPHACDDGALAVLFGANGASAFGALKEDGKLRYLGAPDAAIRAALDNAVGK